MVGSSRLRCDLGRANPCHDCFSNLFTDIILDEVAGRRERLVRLSPRTGTSIDERGLI